MKNDIAIIGLGKMGGNIALRLRQRGWKVLGFDKGYDFSKIKNLPTPRTVIFSVPHDAVDAVGNAVGKFLEEGDIILDLGNSFYKDTIRRAKEYSKKKIKFVDVGISGGPAGARYGASLMVGGDKKTFDNIYDLLKDIAREDGIKFFEGAGAGHFVKMVHNGIEYGMMQSLAEGFTVLKKSKYKIGLRKAAEIYNKGSVIESRLVGWLADAFREYGEEIKKVSGKVGYTGEGEWTVKTAKQLGVPAKVLKEAIDFRKKSHKKPSWTGKLLSALRGQFGGHSIR